MNLKFNYRFTRLYSRVRQDGVFIQSLVAYSKLPWLMKVKNTATGHRKQYVAQYQYHVYLDLWLVKLRFIWYSRELA